MGKHASSCSRSLFTIIVLTCLLSLSTHATPESGRALILSGPPFPTGWYLTEKGDLGGKRPEMFGKIAHRAGYSWIGVLYPAKRLMTSLADGQVDISMLVLNPLLDKPDLILTGKDPLYTENLNVYGKKGSTPVQYRSDLKGKRIVVMRGYGYGGFKAWLDDPDNHIELIEVDTFEQALSVLILRDTDYALLYDLNFEAGLNALLINKQDALLEHALHVTVTPWSKVPVYFHLSRKALPDADIILKNL